MDAGEPPSFALPALIIAGVNIPQVTESLEMNCFFFDFASLQSGSVLKKFKIVPYLFRKTFEIWQIV